MYREGMGKTNGQLGECNFTGMIVGGCVRIEQRLREAEITKNGGRPSRRTNWGDTSANLRLGIIGIRGGDGSQTTRAH